METKTSLRIDLPVLPLRDVVVYPHMVIPLFVGRDRSIKALDIAMNADKQILLIAQKSPDVDDPGDQDLYTVGTLATVLQLLKLPDGTIKVLVEGVARVAIDGFGDREGALTATGLTVDSRQERDEREMAVTLSSLMGLFEQYVKTNRKLPPELLTTLAGIDDAGRVADTIAAHLGARLADKQRLLEILDVGERLETLIGLVDGEIDVQQIEKRIRGRVKSQMERSQREYYLNEQMKAIQKELGDLDEAPNELEELAKKIAVAGMPKAVEQKAKTELAKLKQMSPMSAEATVVRNYLDWLLGVPWKKRTKVRKDLKAAEQILDADHYGLDKVKDRILEYLAVQTRVKQMKGAILCLVGPPGVGKTSLGQSIAKATNRKFIRMSLGGVRDEAEIRGHRRTYIGSMPGRIVQNLSKVGSKNALFMLDEIDKMSMDFRGDPSSALLEVLDPEQNHSFNDHYLEVDLDLSEIMFVATANSLNIPGPLLDRMEVIRIPGYTEDEKLNIAERYLMAKQFKANGLKEDELVIQESALRDIVRYYTRESGVRNLEREIAKIARKVVKEIALAGPRVAKKKGAQSASRAAGHLQEPRQVSRRPEGRFRPCRGGKRSRPGDRPGLDRGRRRPAAGRSLGHAGQGAADPHRPAGRRDAGVGQGRTHRRALAQRAAWPGSRVPPEIRCPRARAGRRHAQGRPERRRGDGDRAGFDPFGRRDAIRCRHDRRDNPARTGTADRRAEGEIAGGAARRHQDGDHPGGEPQGSCRHSEERHARS